MKKNYFLSLALTGLSAASLSQAAFAKDDFRIVGSSTVYPFVTVVAEEFSKGTSYAPPVVESTGTGGGFSLFCAKSDSNRPDLTNASRAIKESERELCANFANDNIVEFKIGYDGVVAASNVEGPKYAFTLQQLRDGVAKYVVINKEVVPNPYTKWSDIDASLPNTDILVYGPPTTSGTRDAINELLLAENCMETEPFTFAHPDEKERHDACIMLREDGAYVDATENDNLIVQKLRSNENAIGIFGYHFLEENLASVQGAAIDGEEPTYENIADGNYPLTRPLYVYANGHSISAKESVKAFLSEMLSEQALGDEGYLTYKGLIPLDKDLRDVNRSALAKNNDASKR